MYGLEVHHNHEQAMELDQMNGRTKWVDYEGLETSQLKEHNVLINDLGHKSNAHPPDGYEATWRVGD